MYLGRVGDLEELVSNEQQLYGDNSKLRSTHFIEVL